MKSGVTDKGDTLRAGRLGEKSVSRGFMAAVTAVMLLYLLLAIYQCLRYQFLEPDFNDYRHTELLISYEGGFVRRGLLGEIIYRICLDTGADPIILIRTLCTAAYLFVALYLVVKFRQKGLTLLLLATPFMCGYLFDLIRKDYIQIALLILIYILLKREKPSAGRIVTAVSIGILGIFIHEAFIFWGLPIVVLTLASRRTTRMQGIAAGSIFIGCFILLAYFKGSPEHAHRIIDSWNSLFGTGVISNKEHSITALSWDTAETIRMHLRLNFHSDALGWSGIVIRPLEMVVIYYFMSNVLFTLRGDNIDTPDSDKTAFSALLIFSVLCLLPMFLFLSCDYGRLYLYLLMSVSTAYVTYAPQRFRSLLPAKALAVTARFNSCLTRICQPGPYLMLSLMLVLAVPHVGYRPVEAFKASPLGFILYDIFSVITGRSHGLFLKSLLLKIFTSDTL